MNNGKLYAYTLHFVQKIEDEEHDLFWLCQAENYEHAKEQLLDAEPDGVLFVEYYKGGVDEYIHPSD